MVRVRVGRAESAEKFVHVRLVGDRESDGEMWASEGGEYLEARGTELVNRWQVHESVRGEAFEESIERGSADVVERAEDRHSPYRLPIEDERVVSAERVLQQSLRGRRAAADDDDRVCWWWLITNMATQLVAIV